MGALSVNLSLCPQIFLKYTFNVLYGLVLIKFGFWINLLNTMYQILEVGHCDIV